MRKYIIFAVIILFLPLSKLWSQNTKSQSSYDVSLAKIKEMISPPKKSLSQLEKLEILARPKSNPNLKEKVTVKKVDYLAALKKLLGIKDVPTKNKVSFNQKPETPKTKKPEKPKKKKVLTSSVGNIGNKLFSETEEKTGRIVIVSHPTNQLDSGGITLTKELDLSFNAHDYEEVRRWAENNGQVSLIPVVIARYGDIIRSLSAEFNVNYRVIVAIIVHESGGNPRVVSWAGASGLMQLMPGTAACYNVHGKAVFDPYTNLRAGVHYYSDMLRMFGNDKEALMAYGLGAGGARKKMNKGIRADEYRPVQEVLYLIERVK